MLVISRKESESIRIQPAEGLNPALTLREVFQHGPIVVKLVRVGHRRVRLVIDAPVSLKVWRDAEPQIPRESGCAEPGTATHDAPARRSVGPSSRALPK